MLKLRSDTSLKLKVWHVEASSMCSVAGAEMVQLLVWNEQCLLHGSFFNTRYKEPMSMHQFCHSLKTHSCYEANLNKVTGMYNTTCKIQQWE